MATLEKIRSKSVFLFIIIIVALIAFILGDFLNSGRSYFGSGTTMYSAGSRKVDLNDYQQQIDALGNTGQDPDEQRQAMMQFMLLGDLMQEQYDQLGIKVTRDEISTLMNHHMPMTQQMAQAAAALGLPPTMDRSIVIDAINNPSRYGLTQDQRAYLNSLQMNEENELENALKSQALMTLISGLFTANQIDAKAAYDNSMAQMPVEFVSASTVGIPDADIEISDADLKAKWEEMKYIYAVEVYKDLVSMPMIDNQGRDNRIASINEPVRLVDYVAVDIVPSAADYAAAQAEVDATVAALKEQPALEGLTARDKFLTESYTLSKADMAKDAHLRTLADSSLMAGAVTAFPLNRSNNTFTVVKVLDSKVAIDSVNSSLYILPIADTDSVMALVNAGTTIAEMIAQNPGNGIDGRWARMEVSQFQPQDPMSLPELKERVVSAPVGKPMVYVDSARQISILYQVNDKKAADKFYDIVVANYTVDPSATTISELKQTLSSFLASNHSGDAFSAKADSLYSLQHALVSASTPHVGALESTRPAVKWAMQAKPGEVSPIFDTPKEYVVVAVKEAFEDFIPYNSPLINAQLKMEVMKDKKAEKMIEKIGTANSLAEYASKMESEIRTDSAVVFNSTRVGNQYGDNSKLLASMAAAQPGQVVGPIQNNGDVVVFVVGEGSSDNRRPYDFNTDAASFIRDFGIQFNAARLVNSSLFKMFVGDRKVKNNSLNFERGQEDM